MPSLKQKKKKKKKPNFITVPSEIATKKTKSTVVSKIKSSRRHSWVGVQVILSGPQLQSSYIVSSPEKSPNSSYMVFTLHIPLRKP